MSGLVERRRDAGMRQILAQVLDCLAVQHVAVMRPVQDALGAVEQHPHARPGQEFDGGSQVMQQGLN